MPINYQQVYQVSKHLVALWQILRMKWKCKLSHVFNQEKIFSVNRDGDIVVPMGPGVATTVNNGKGFSLN